MNARIDDRCAASSTAARPTWPRTASGGRVFRGGGGASAAVQIEERLEAVAAAQLRAHAALGEIRVQEGDDAAVDLDDGREVDRRLLDAGGRVADRRDERRRLASAQPSGQADASVHAVDSPLCRIGARVHATMQGSRRTARRESSARVAPGRHLRERRGTGAGLARCRCPQRSPPGRWEGVSSAPRKEWRE